jgi:hypothetical protein
MEYVKMNHSPLKIALIVDSDIVSTYVHELVQWSKQQDNLAITQLIIQGGGKPARLAEKADALFVPATLLRLARELSFNLITKAENVMLAGTPLHRDHLRTCSLKEEIPCSITVNPEILGCGEEYRYTDEDVGKIRALNLDLIIHCGAGMLRGDILNAAVFGIIALDYGWGRSGQSGVPGFWEVYFRKDATRFAIRQLTDRDDGGRVLMWGQFQTKFYYLLNQASLRKKSNAQLMKLVARLAAERTFPVQEGEWSALDNFRREPGLAIQFGYACRLGATIGYKVLTRLLLKRDYRWAFAFSKNDWTSLVMGRSNRVTNPPNHFLADPFVVREDNYDFCFVEDYDYARKRGCISVYELKDQSAEALGEAIVEPFHMSFPYLFRFRGKLYMCPETSENRDIRLYECVKFPLEWKLSKILMDNISAADTMIFEKDGVWWMFTNIDSANADDNSAELFIFFTDDPIDGKWKAHPRNPLFIDSSKARNAGLLFDGDAVYRVGQRQAFDMYGHGFSINKISILNKERYVETELRSVKPTFFSNLKGTHHLPCNGSVSVFEYGKLTAVSY